MTPGSAPAGSPLPRVVRLALLRWLTPAVLLTGEVLALTLAFSADVAPAGAAGRLLARSPQLLQVGLAMLVVTAALAALSLRDEFVRAALATGPLRRSVPWLLLHLGVFTAFFVATDHLLGAGRADPSWPLVLGWVVLGCAVPATAGLIAVGPRQWRGLIGRGWWAAAAGLVVGAGAWWVGQASQVNWDVLAAPTLWAAYLLVRLACSDAVCEPEELVLGTTSFRVQVAAFCSGLEGVGLLLVYLSAYLVYMRRALRFPQALLLLPIGAGVAWLANAFRVAGIVVVGDRVSPEVALGGVHSQLGWLAFNAVAVGLVWAAHRSPLFSRRAPLARPGDNPTAAYLAPLLTLLACGMLTSAAFNDSPAAYPLRVVAGALVLGYYWPCYDELRQGSTGWRGLAWPILVGAAVFVVWRLLEPPPSEDLPDPRATLAEAPGWFVVGWVILRAVGSVVVVPLAEELAFRGYLLRRLESADFRAVPLGRFRWWSFLASSLLFGLLHERWLAGTLAGMAFAAVLCRRGRLADAVLAHAVSNGLLAAAALATGNWRAWS